MAEERIIDRLDRYMKYKGINDNQVTVNAALSVGLLGNARKGDHDLGKKAVEKILKFYQELNRVWLLTGEGEMLTSSTNIPPDRKPPLIRILDILEKEGYSINEFDALTGKKFGEWFLNNAIKYTGNNDGAMREWAELVSSTFPQYPLEYILYGVPLHNESTTKANVPLYDFCSGFYDKSVEPVDFLQIPGLPPADGAIYVRGESMSPLIKSGDIVIYKKVALSEDNIIWGQIYLLSYTFDQDSYTAVKYLRRSERHGYIRLVSENPSFDPQEILYSSITALALVKASITFHTIE